MNRSSFAIWWSHWRREITHFIVGGSWDNQLSPTMRHNLRWFWVDGVFAQVVESITLAYLSLYVLALGATHAQIGWMSALGSLAAAFMLWPGARLAGQPARRQSVVIWSGGIVARVVLVVLMLLPLVTSGALLIYFAIALSVIRDAAANLGLPGWVAITADIVPIQWRGRYFGSRSFAMGLMGMATTFLVGQLITRFNDSLLGYQVTLGLAFAAGMISTFSFSRLHEPRATKAAVPESTVPLIQHLRGHPEFIVFCAVTALWNFALNVSGPFFNIYIVEGLRGDAAYVGMAGVIQALSGLPGQRVFGSLSDKWGPRRVQLLTGLLIPTLPLSWIFATAPWHPFIINSWGGFLWAGYALASFNFLLTVAPAEQRPMYVAVYQVVVLGALAAGAALGGVVVDVWGYKATFLISGVGRFIAALLFARLVTDSQNKRVGAR